MLLDPGIGPAGPDIDHGQAVTENDPFGSLEEALSGSGRAVFQRPLGVHKECDTFPAQPRDPAGYDAGDYWL